MTRPTPGPTPSTPSGPTRPPPNPGPPPARLPETILRLILASLFLWAGVAKATDLPGFALAIARYRLIPWDAAVLAALYLPWLEIAAGVALATRRLFLGALLISTFLSGLFLAALVSTTVRGIEIDCGCFGPGSNASTGWAVFRAAAMLLASAALLRCAIAASHRKANPASPHWRFTQNPDTLPNSDAVQRPP